MHLLVPFDIIYLMKTRFVSVDRNQPMLLPPDLRDWIPEDDLVNFVIHAVDGLSMSAFKVNYSGSGSAQYPPHMMLSLLIYCYANGVFSSRRIERATYRDIGVRFLTGDTHPDHDTICKFRRENFDAVASCFLYVLELARELKLLKLGTVSVDGTTIKANASKRRSLRYDRAGEIIEQLKLDVAELLEQAEKTDQRNELDGQSLPEEIARREKLERKLDDARKNIEERNKKMVAEAQDEYERKVEMRKKRKTPSKGRSIKKPNLSTTPAPKMQGNLTDPDSRVMRHNKSSAFEQAYNAQATVDADGSQLVLSAHVSQRGTDHKELVSGIEGIPESIGKPKTVLADKGYLNELEVRTLEGDDEEPAMNVLVSVSAEAKQLNRKYDFRTTHTEEEKEENNHSEFVHEMIEKMGRDESREKYRLRKQTVEPVFGTIKQWMGFRQFLLRGYEKVNGEWELVTLAYNIKRLWKMQCAPI